MSKAWPAQTLLDAVFDVHADVLRLTDQFRLLHRKLTIGHSVPYRDDNERRLIGEVKGRYRALSDDQRRQFPQLGLDVSLAGDRGRRFPRGARRRPRGDAAACRRRGKGRGPPVPRTGPPWSCDNGIKCSPSFIKAIVLDGPVQISFPVHGQEVLSILGTQEASGSRFCAGTVTPGDRS